MLFLNWKLNGSHQFIEEYTAELLPPLSGVHHAVFPPAAYLAHVSEYFIAGAQNISMYESGSYTGEISASMVLDCKAKYALVGHSERRSIFKETINEVSKKVDVALKSGIIPVLCIGESLEERKSGIYLDVIKSQMASYKNGAIVAYEPVWSIGTGVVPSMDEISQALEFIKTLAPDAKVLYGGSVNAKNISEILNAGADGVLVGSASLKIDEVKAMAQIIASR